MFGSLRYNIGTARNSNGPVPFACIKRKQGNFKPEVPFQNNTGLPWTASQKQCVFSKNNAFFSLISFFTTTLCTIVWLQNVFIWSHCIWKSYKTDWNCHIIYLIFIRLIFFSNNALLCHSLECVMFLSSYLYVTRFLKSFLLKT